MFIGAVSEAMATRQALPASRRISPRDRLEAGGRFLEHRPCKCVGCWKVYENEEAAKKTFAKYKACTRVYCRQLASGIDIERLTVAG